VAAMAPAAGAVTAAPSGWQVVPSPNPPNGAALAGVTAVSPTNFWAVGVDIAPDRSGRPFILHQTGTGAWHAVDVPALRSVSGRLAAVSAGSANDVWAVGVRAVPGAPLTAPSDGHAWSSVAVPVPVPHAELVGLTSISAVSPHDIWAVGQGHLTEHWNGHAWQAVPAPAGSTDPDATTNLNGVSARSARDVWAVGTVSGTPSPRTVTEHWNGTTWTLVPSPTPGPATGGPVRGRRRRRPRRRGRRHPPAPHRRCPGRSGTPAQHR